MHTLTTFIQHSIGDDQGSYSRKKKLKSFKLKRKVKASLFADDIILHIENPKDLTKILEREKQI